MQRSSFSIRVVAEVSTMVALGTVLSMIKVYHLPQGGSITAGSMVPLLWISLRRGPKVGLFAAALFGLLQFALEPWFIHPIQLLLDYPVAFGCVGLAGLLKKQALAGIAMGLFGRFTSHFFSGVWFFSQYAPEGMSPYIYSAIYNGSYIIGEFFVSAVLIFVLVKKNLIDIYI